VAGSFVVTVNNSGSIISERRFAVRGVNGQESVINSGLIRSDAGTAIDLRGGNDSVILRTGSQIIGLADGGTGTDRVVLEGSGTASNDFQNFETLRMTGADWTWSGNGTFVGTQIESGVLRVGGTLTSPVTVQTGTTLQIGTGGTTGTVARDITDNGSVVFNRSNAVTFAGVVSGTGSLTQAVAELPPSPATTPIQVAPTSTPERWPPAPTVLLAGLRAGLPSTAACCASTIHSTWHRRERLPSTQSGERSTRKGSPRP